MTWSPGIMIVLCSCLYVYMYVCMFPYNKVVRNNSCGVMIANAREQHEEVPGLMRNQLGRVVTTNI